MDGEGERSLSLLSVAGSAPVSFSWPMPLNDDKETTNEVIETIRLVCQDERETFPQLWQELDQILRDCDTRSYQDMKQICDRYNQLVDEIMQQDPGVPHRFRGRPSVDLLRHIIQQCYNRAVVDPEKLNQYEPFSAGVYGETSFELIDQMINTISLTENDVFIDLGSGVGQVVLQVAAATNCKLCIGIEKANWPAQYAEQMICEFRRWMEFYGKTYSNFELVKGDFLSEEHRATISASTVIFVNNFAFGPEVDLQLKERFHDLREGSKIMSSREFRPMNMQISERNLSDIGAILTVEELSPLRGPVSWTHKPVSYFLHTIDRTQLENFYFSRRNGLKLTDQPKKYVQKSRVLREGRNNRVVTRQQRMSQSKKLVRFPSRLPSRRRREWLKAFQGVHQSALKLVCTIQVPEKTAFVQDAEKNARNGLRAVQSLRRTRREDLRVKMNCTGLRSEMQTGTLMVLRECQQEKQTRRLKLPNGVVYKEERFRIGKRNETVKDSPRPKRRKTVLTDEVRSSSSTENTLTLDTARSGISSSQTHSDEPRAVQSTGAEVTPRRNVDEMLDLHILRSLLVANGTIRERKAADGLRNVREVRPRRTSMADKETRTDKRQRPGLPLSDVNGNGREERNARETDRTERPSGTTSNRWLFDIRLAPSPLCQVEGQIGSEVEDTFDSSGTSLNRLSEKLQRESRFGKNDRIVVNSYPSRADHGFFQTKDRCKRGIRSKESSFGALSCDDDRNASGDTKTLESVRSVQNNLNIASERKTAKKACDGSAGLHHSTERALFSHFEESFWEPCWAEDECGEEELDEALKILHQETGRVARTGLSNPDQFNIDWMNRNARNICSVLPLPETEPISGSSDVADPPKFFSPNNTAVSTWLVNHLKHDDDEDEYKPLDCFKASAEQKAVSTHKPVHVSLPGNLLQNKCIDANASCPLPVSSVPASLPHEAALSSRCGPDLQFRCKLSPSPDLHVSPNLLQRKTVAQSKGAPTASVDMKPWDISSFIPASVPSETLSTKQELEDFIDRNSISDAVGCHGCSSFTRSTVSHGDSQVVESSLPAETEDLMESKHQPSSIDEAEIPPSLQNLLDSFKSLYMNFLVYQKSPSCHREAVAEIEAQKNHRTAAVALENELSCQILQLEEENAALLKQRLLEVGIVASNKAEFFEEANSLVLRNKFLRMQAIYIHHQVVLEQEKLFKKYEEFCSTELLRRMSFQDMFPESSRHAADENLPSVGDLSICDTTQVLDIALHKSNLDCSRIDFAHDKPIGSCVGAAAADPSEACDVMPKLNLSVGYSKEDEDQTKDDGDDDARSKSRPGSPELDMPLLMPELENLAPRGWSPVEESSGCAVRISVKLPLRKLMRPKKPADLNLTIPTPEVNRSQSGATSKLPLVSPPSECQPVENDRLNMYSPISQASSIENLATVDDHTEQGNSLIMRSFSPISSPGSVRMSSLERPCFPGECDDYALNQMETKPLQSFGAGSQQQPVFDHWEHISSQTTVPDAKFPFPPSEPFESSSSKPDALTASGELQSFNEFGSVCTKVSVEQFAGRVDDGCPNYFHQGSFEDMTSLGLRLDRNFSSGSTPFEFEHCASASLDIGTVKPGLAEETDDAIGQCKPWRHDDRNRTAIVKLLESPSRFHNAAEATCRQFSRNSLRPSVDTLRQMELRSDSRDSGLGKESEIDCDRFLTLQNEHVVFGALGRGANSPRTLANCLPSLGDALSWQPALHLQTDDSSDGRRGDISGRKTLNRIPLGDSIPEDPDQWPLPYSMFPDSNQSRLPSLSTFGHRPPSEHLLSEFRLSQKEMLGIHDGRGDLDRYRHGNGFGNYSQVDRSADYSEMNCHQNWTDGRLSAAKSFQPTDTVSLGAEQFAKSKPFDAVRWRSYLASKGCYNQKRQFLTTEDMQPSCLRTSCPAPNSRLGLEPCFSPSYFNPPHSYHFYSECTV